MKTIHVNSLEELSGAAKTIADQFQSGDVVAFYGAMGAGKTTLIKELALQLGVSDQVSSPTFALVNEYRASNDMPVYHFDFYRINSLREVYDMGYEEYFYGKGICLIEWAELVEELLPDDVISLCIEVNDDDSREITIK